MTRRYRERGLSRRQYERACEQFETEWDAYVRVELHREVLSAARDLIQRHALRGFDGVHLASAVVLQRGLGESVTFVAADERLFFVPRQPSACRLSTSNPPRSHLGRNAGRLRRK